MLYVSRVIPVGKFGVVDTDDGVETVVSWMDIRRYVRDYHLEIMGVEVKQTDHGLVVGAVEPYQAKEHYSALQAKTQALRGVDIHTYNGEITGIYINCKLIKNGYVLHLSKYGKSVTQGVIIRHTNKEYFQNRVVIVLDNGIVNYHTMPPVCMNNITWDIRSLPDKVVESMYLELMDSSVIRPAQWDKFIIDSPERIAFWKCLKLLDKKDASAEYFDAVLSSVKDKQALTDKVADACINDFRAVASMESITILPVYRDGFKEVMRKYNMCIGKSDFKSMWENLSRVFAMLEASSTMGYESLKRFENFLLYFDAPKDIQDLFITLCTNIMNLNP